MEYGYLFTMSTHIFGHVKSQYMWIFKATDDICCVTPDT